MPDYADRFQNGVDTGIASMPSTPVTVDLVDVEPVSAVPEIILQLAADNFALGAVTTPQPPRPDTGVADALDAASCGYDAGSAASGNSDWISAMAGCASIGPSQPGGGGRPDLTPPARSDAPSREATSVTGGVDDAVRAGRVGDSVPDPAPVRRPSGAPDRDSPWYVSYRDADGYLHTVGNSGGVHAEMRIQQMEPGAPMSRPFGWRTVDDSSGPQWVPGTVYRDCQRLPRELFPDNIEGAPGGPWDLW